MGSAEGAAPANEFAAPYESQRAAREEIRRGDFNRPCYQDRPCAEGAAPANEFAAPYESQRAAREEIRSGGLDGSFTRQGSHTTGRAVFRIRRLNKAALSCLIARVPMV